MAKAGRIITAIVGISLAIGIILFAVGMFTGAIPQRIYQTVESEMGYSINPEDYIPWVNEELIPWVKNDLSPQLQDLWSNFFAEVKSLF